LSTKKINKKGTGQLSIFHFLISPFDKKGTGQLSLAVFLIFQKSPLTPLLQREEQKFSPFEKGGLRGISQ
jgi:hypothetical protein